MLLTGDVNCPLSTGQKIQNLDILRLPTIKVKQDLPKKVKLCAKDALGFASMLFDFDRLMFYHPFADPICPTETKVKRAMSFLSRSYTRNGGRTSAQICRLPKGVEMITPYGLL